MKKKIQENQKTILAASLTTTLLLLTAFTTAQITTQDHGEQHTLEGNILPTQSISQTEATFRAEITDKSDNYDAALVYWNYTNEDTGENHKGPANIATEEGETVESFQPGLSAETGYDVEAYTEPIVWDDETLAANFVTQVEEASQIDSFNDQDAMEGLASSEVAMEEVSRSNIGKPEFLLSGNFDVVYDSKSSSENFFAEFGFDRNEDDIEFPYSLNGYDSDVGDYEVRLTENTYNGEGRALEVDYLETNNWANEKAWGFKADLSDVSEIQFRADDTDGYDLAFWVEDSYDPSPGDETWHRFDAELSEVQSYDVSDSGYDGEHYIWFGFRSDTSGGVYVFDEIQLIEE